MSGYRMRAGVSVLALAIGLCAAFFWSVGWKKQHTQPRQIEESSVAMPAVVQLGFAFGDRYLAANIGAFRSQTVGTHELKPDTYIVLSRIQLATAQLNPKHEDNYYTAAAILPWHGQVETAQQILGYATTARQRDAMPPFFRGFNKYYFQRDFASASQDMLLAADRSEAVNARALRSIASNWLERGYEPQQARSMILAMARSSDDARLTGLLNARAARLQGLIALQAAVDQYKKQQGRVPATLDDLLRHGLLKELPLDPLGAGYILDENGVPQIARKIAQ